MTRAQFLKSLFTIPFIISLFPLFESLLKEFIQEPELKSFSFDGETFSEVRRIMPELVSPDLVSVQPMSEPTGLIFHLNPIYDKDYKTTNIKSRYSDRVFAPKPTILYNKG